MTRLSLPLAFFLSTCMMSPAPAQQLPQCGPYPAHVEAWSALYGEAPIMAGLSQGGNMLLLIVNPETGGWTVFHISSQGLACAVDAGRNAQLSPPETPGEPS